jgi:YHS domain-containing protein
MRTNTIALTALAAIAMATPALAQHKRPPKAEALVCPVMGGKIASKQAAAGHSTYKGKTYYFCCAGCKPQFDKDPAGVLAAAAKRAKGK